VTVRRRCPHCGGLPAITPTGRYWTHGRPECDGSRRIAIPAPHLDRHIWPKRHRGRRVTTIPGPDTWNPEENAA
jgi:hypothetical protein